PPSGQRGQNFYRLSAEEKIVVLDGNGRLSKGGGLLFNVLHPAILDLPDLVPRMIIHAANRTAASTPPSFVEELRLGIDIAHWAYASHLEEHLGRLLSQCLTQRQLKALHSSETTVEQQVKRIAGCRPLVAALSETRLLTKKNAPWYEAEEQTIIFFHILERYRLYENAVAIVHAAAAQMSLLDGKISGLLLPGQPLTALEKADIEFVRSLDRKSEKTFVTVITRAVAEAAQTYPLPPLLWSPWLLCSHKKPTLANPLPNYLSNYREVLKNIVLLACGSSAMHYSVRKTSTTSTMVYPAGDDTHAWGFLGCEACSRLFPFLTPVRVSDMSRVWHRLVQEPLRTDRTLSDLKIDSTLNIFKNRSARCLFGQKVVRLLETDADWHRAVYLAGVQEEGPLAFTEPEDTSFLLPRSNMVIETSGLSSGSSRRFFEAARGRPEASKDFFRKQHREQGSGTSRNDSESR
ncbi:hypothetical protein CPB83DRAFT_841349, partial [Crepidotus variabilis]